LVVFIAVLPADTHADADRLLDRLLGYRVFDDDSGRMNLSLGDTGGGLLLVPQFTLAADTRKGMRPSFSGAAPPAQGRELFAYLVERAAERHRPVESGQFAAHMLVSLTNDGPVTLWLES
jgi:D-aminoacyl-tRNA deacylase